MKRWWYARARADLTQIRKPGGRGFLGHSPEWIDYTTSPDFWRKQRRKGLVEVLSEADENPKTAPREEPKAKKPTKAQRRKQVEIDLENTDEAIETAKKDVERLKKFTPDEGDRAALAAEVESVELRLAILKKTKARLEKELSVEPPKGGDEEE